MLCKERLTRTILYLYVFAANSAENSLQTLESHRSPTRCMCGLRLCVAGHYSNQPGHHNGLL